MAASACSDHKSNSSVVTGPTVEWQAMATSDDFLHTGFILIGISQTSPERKGGAIIFNDKCTGGGVIVNDPHVFIVESPIPLNCKTVLKLQPK
jgi:hypothetical protein